MNNWLKNIKNRTPRGILVIVVGGWLAGTVACGQEDHDHADHAGHDHEAHADHAGQDEQDHAVNHEVAAHEGHDHPEDRADPQEEDHAGHDHVGHGHEEPDSLWLSPEQQERFGIATSTAGPGVLDKVRILPGEVLFNGDRLVHMVPRVEGIVRAVIKGIGDRVEEGEVMAVIDSRELADAKAGFIAAHARHELAEKVFDREKELREQRVSSEQDFLEAEQGLEEARIVLRAARQKLEALGFEQDYIASLEAGKTEAITRYEIKAPMDGVITEKHVARGESLDGDTHIFTLSDARTVWVELTVYARDLDAVYAGQAVRLKVEHNGREIDGTISMVTPFLDPETRSARARMVLDNTDNRLVPGTFVSGTIVTEGLDAPIVVPLDAVQTIDGEPLVFVETKGGFEPVPVQLGRRSSKGVEVLSGLPPGARYVSSGAFHLKASIITSHVDPHAGHGH